jgi:hypothetical protein
MKPRGDMKVLGKGFRCGLVFRTTAGKCGGGLKNASGAILKSRIFF